MSVSRAETACSFCGLPAPPPATAGEPAYCCLGCRIAEQVTQSRGEAGAANWLLARLAGAVFCTINVTVCTMILWSDDLFPPDNPSRLSVTLDQFLRYTALLFALPVWFWLGQSLWGDAWRELRRGKFSTDLLFLTGILAAYVSSAVAVFRGTGDLYLEVACVVLVLLTLGRWFQARSKLHAAEVLDQMQKLLPDSVCRVRGEHDELVSAGEIRAGDELRVRAGERFPTDGVLLSSRVTVDEQFLTGESWPLERVAGERIPGGALNLDGDVRLRATAAVADGTLARMMDAVREARQKKGAYERLAERLAAWFTPAVFVVAVAATVGHTLLSGWGTGLLTGLSVLLIACPCALGLAAPLAVWVALGRAAGRQVLFRSGEALERLAGVRSVAFDKTGTLTTGQPVLARVRVAPQTNTDDVWQLAASLARSSGHPLSQGIAQSWPNRAGDLSLDDVRVVSGRGVSGVIGVNGVREAAGTSEIVRLGSSRWLREFVPPAEWDQPWVREMPGRGPLVWLAVGKRLQGVFEFREELRPSVQMVCRELRDRGLQLVMLTGDRQASAVRLGEDLGLEILAELTPEAKQAAVEALRRTGPVLVVGDGINDAPALAAAEVGLALGCGTDVARTAAEICLLSDELDRLPWAIDLAQATVRTIRRNLGWAFCYNGVGVIVAAAGWLNPIIAALLMTGSSLAVIFQSLRLAHFPVPEIPKNPPENSAPELSPVRPCEEVAACGTGC